MTHFGFEVSKGIKETWLSTHASPSSQVEWAKAFVKRRGSPGPYTAGGRLLTDYRGMEQMAGLGMIVEADATCIADEVLAEGRSWFGSARNRESLAARLSLEAAWDEDASTIDCDEVEMMAEEMK